MHNIQPHIADDLSHTLAVALVLGVLVMALWMLPVITGAI